METLVPAPVLRCRSLRGNCVVHPDSGKGLSRERRPRVTLEYRRLPESQVPQLLRQAGDQPAVFARSFNRIQPLCRYTIGQQLVVRMGRKQGRLGWRVVSGMGLAGVCKSKALVLAPLFVTAQACQAGGKGVGHTKLHNGSQSFCQVVEVFRFGTTGLQDLAYFFRDLRRNPNILNIPVLVAGMRLQKTDSRLLQVVH